MIPLNVNTTLLLVGLVLLLLNVIIGAATLRQGRVRAGLINVLLAIAACAAIVVGLVGMSFTAPANAAAPAAVVSPATSGGQGNQPAGRPANANAAAPAGSAQGPVGAFPP